MLARLVLLALLAIAALAQPPASVFGQVDEMTAALSEITGWPILRRVPSEMLGQDRFRRMVESGVKKASGNNEIRADELTLKIFGFVPQDFDLVRESVDLVSEQAAAFYDYKKKRLFILESTPAGPDQQLALVHELAHALADQHHRLGRYLNHGSPDDDASTAREAVMEGQATWLAWAYMSKRTGGKGEVPANVLKQITSASDADNADYPVFAKAPLYIRESLIFPYNQGMLFQDAVYHKLGRHGFDTVFTDPPLSTQQIMHPETYLSGKKPEDPDPPSLDSILGKESRRFRLLAEGTLGEFDHSVLLRQYVGEKVGEDAARHWRGGTYRLYEQRQKKSPLLLYASEWDSPESARVYFGLYRRVLKGKWKKMSVATDGDDEVNGTGDSGGFRLSISGAKVQCIEGLPSS